MFVSLIARVVETCRRFSLLIALLALAASVGCCAFVASHMKINTDVNQLLAEDLDWRKREKELELAFPQKVDRLVVVIDGENADVAEAAASSLAKKMEEDPETFRNVTRPDSIPYFKKVGILFLSEETITSMLEGMIQAQPILGTLANDPSLRGLFGAFGLVFQGLQQGEVTYDKLDKPLDKLAASIEGTVAGSPKPFAWRSLMEGEPKLRDIRKFILTQPKLDYSDLMPGSAASQKLRALAKDLGLTPDNGVTVRLTGSVALNDDEFASVADGTLFVTGLSFGLVLVILFLALRSLRLVLPILITLVIGLIATTVFALATIGSLNLISVAFAVMFVGVAVDFGIQFGVRYRDQHHNEPDPARALTETAKIIAKPLALAAAATAIGLLAFIPTDYRGVGELGFISGAGMIIAYLLNITVLPALLTLFKPPAEPEAVGFAWAAPIDSFLLAKRRPVLIGALVLGLVGGVFATHMHFDFDPLNLKDPKSESLSTLYSLMVDPDATPYTVDILEPSLDKAREVAAQLDKLPEVDHTITFASFVPEDQDKKLPLLQDANNLLGPTLNPPAPLAAPTQEDVIATLRQTAEGLKALGTDHPSAQRLAKALDDVIQRNDPALFARLQKSLVDGLQAQLDTIRPMLEAGPVELKDITDDLKRDWITPDGRAKIEVYPKGDARDYKVLTKFTAAVRKIAPEASGSSISIQESGDTIVKSFLQAGLFAFLVIALLLRLALGNSKDVLALLAPIFLAGILTLATMVIIRLPLNFANIIAFPLLLSLGVSYAIYFVVFAREGQTNPLASSMARAVLFSASTTLVAFGSLSLSTHVGTSGMGKLLTIALLYCVLCSFTLLPALLGGRRSS